MDLGKNTTEMGLASSHRVGGIWYQHDLLLVMLALITWLRWCQFLHYKNYYCWGGECCSSVVGHERPWVPFPAPHTHLLFSFLTFFFFFWQHWGLMSCILTAVPKCACVWDRVCAPWSLGLAVWKGQRRAFLGWALPGVRLRLRGKVSMEQWPGPCMVPEGPRTLRKRKELGLKTVVCVRMSGERPPGSPTSFAGCTHRRGWVWGRTGSIIPNQMGPTVHTTSKRCGAQPYLTSGSQNHPFRPLAACFQEGGIAHGDTEPEEARSGGVRQQSPQHPQCHLHLQDDGLSPLSKRGPWRGSAPNR
jgi:hypothetical protein